MSIADNIIKRREELGLSQADLARLSGVSPATISRWETGERVPSRYNLERLTEALQTTASWVHGDSDRPSDIDPGVLASAIEALEQTLGQRFSSLTASHRAKLLAFVYSRGGDISAKEAQALLSLIA